MIYSPLPDGPTVHHLKTWPRYFYAVDRCQKRFELRLDDRGFKLGDILILCEWNPATEKYTGQSVKLSIAKNEENNA